MSQYSEDRYYHYDWDRRIGDILLSDDEKAFMKREQDEANRRAIEDPNSQYNQRKFAQAEWDSMRPDERINIEMDRTYRRF